MILLASSCYPIAYTLIVLATSLVPVLLLCILLVEDLFDIVNPGVLMGRRLVSVRWWIQIRWNVTRWGIWYGISSRWFSEIQVKQVTAKCLTWLSSTECRLLLGMSWRIVKNAKAIWWNVWLWRLVVIWTVITGNVVIYLLEAVISFFLFCEQEILTHILLFRLLVLEIVPCIRSRLFFKHIWLLWWNILLRECLIVVEVCLGRLEVRIGTLGVVLLLCLLVVSVEETTKLLENTA
jgi:hypothetical protein